MNFCVTTAGRYLRYGLVGALMSAALPASAASVSFFLDQSNALPDGTNYLSVTLTENDSGGVDFLVQTLDPLSGIAGGNFGIQKFGFSFLDDIGGEISNLPDGWQIKNNKGMDGFGKFDIRLEGTGNSRTDNLSFTVDGVTLADFDSLFSAHAAGFFAGSLPPPNPVPVPAAVWLFGSGLLGLFGIARHRSFVNRERVFSVP